MKSYYDELGLFKNISEEGLNEIENQEKAFTQHLNKVLNIKLNKLQKLNV